MHPGMGGRIDAVLRAEVIILTTCWLTEPVGAVTRLPRQTDFRGMHADRKSVV